MKVRTGLVKTESKTHTHIKNNMLILIKHSATLGERRLVTVNIVNSINFGGERGFVAHLVSNRGWFKINLVDNQNRSYFIAVGKGSNKKAQSFRENEVNKLFIKASRSGRYTDLAPNGFNLIKA